MRAAVVTCTTARTAAAVANHTLNAIVEEKTVVTRSAYESETLAIGTS